MGAIVPDEAPEHLHGVARPFYRRREAGCCRHELARLQPERVVAEMIMRPGTTAGRLMLMRRLEPMARFTGMVP